MANNLPFPSAGPLPSNFHNCPPPIPPLGQGSMSPHPVTPPNPFGDKQVQRRGLKPLPSGLLKPSVAVESICSYRSFEPSQLVPQYEVQPPPQPSSQYYKVDFPSLQPPNTPPIAPSNNCPPTPVLKAGPNSASSATQVHFSDPQNPPSINQQDKPPSKCKL